MGFQLFARVPKEACESIDTSWPKITVTGGILISETLSEIQQNHTMDLTFMDMCSHICH